MGLIVSLPKCEWCGTIEGVYVCKVCDKWTCNDCLVYTVSWDEYVQCEHIPYQAKPVKPW